MNESLYKNIESVRQNLTNELKRFLDDSHSTSRDEQSRIELPEVQHIDATVWLTNEPSRHTGL